MRHHLYNPGFKFVVEPEHFNKYTDRELLQYCLGAAELYGIGLYSKNIK